MKDVYAIYRDNKDFIGVLTIDIEHSVFQYIPNNGFPVHYHPIFMLSKLEDKTDIIRRWVLDRVPDRCYKGVDILMKRARLKGYDAYGFFKYNEGQSFCDKLICKLTEGEVVWTVTDFENGADNIKL